MDSIMREMPDGISRSGLSAHRAILVNPTEDLSRRVARVAEIEQVFEHHGKGVRLYVQALRLHHWLKNLLVFVPLTLAYRLSELDLLAYACLAFLAFGLCASSVYLINDLVDLPADRHHPRKRERPFAAGELSLSWGLGSVPLLLGLEPSREPAIALAFPRHVGHLLSIKPGLFIYPETDRASGRDYTCGALHHAHHGRLGSCLDMAVFLASGLLDLPVFESCSGQALCRTGDHGC